jgi:hypothetical protein
MHLWLNALGRVVKGPLTLASIYQRNHEGIPEARVCMRPRVRLLRGRGIREDACSLCANPLHFPVSIGGKCTVVTVLNLHNDSSEFGRLKFTP